MRKLMSLFALVAFMAFVASGVYAADAKFVGASKCKACHSVATMGGTGYKVWEASAHAKAYKTLLSDEAKKIAKEKGLKVAANEAPECLKCHVTGGGVAKNVDATFKKEEGVSCEACHGAASGFLMLHNKKDEASKKKAVEAGLVKLEKNEKLCVTCHNSESPTFKGFKFAEAWKKIEHSGPAKK